MTNQIPNPKFIEAYNKYAKILKSSTNSAISRIVIDCISTDLFSGNYKGVGSISYGENIKQCELLYDLMNRWQKIDELIVTLCKIKRRSNLLETELEALIFFSRHFGNGVIDTIKEKTSIGYILLKD